MSEASTELSFNPTLEVPNREDVVTTAKERTREINAKHEGNPDFAAEKLHRRTELSYLTTALARGEITQQEFLDVVSAGESQESTESHLDPLTGLYNRAAGEQRLNEELARAKREGRPLTAVMVDLDKFKDINDRAGHDGGDAVLRETAKHLQTQTRQHDVAIRWGGEEMIVLLPNTDEEGAKIVIERLRETMPGAVKDKLGAKFQLGRDVTMSTGIAQTHMDTNGLNPDQEKERIIKEADRRVYLAKANGRNRSVTEADAAILKPKEGSPKTLIKKDAYGRTRPVQNPRQLQPS